jgi:hypothetical protein
MHRACCYAAFAALTFLAADPAAAQKHSLVVACATADAGKLDRTDRCRPTGACSAGCSMRWCASSPVRSPESIEPDLAELDQQRRQDRMDLQDHKGDVSRQLQRVHRRGCRLPEAIGRPGARPSRAT